MPSPRPRLVLGTLVLSAEALALPAEAAPLPDRTVNVVSGPQASATGYVTSRIVATAGTTVSLLNADTTTHDVTSRLERTVVVRNRKKKVPVFASAITPAGGMSAVVGTAKLPPGSYDFYCSLHPGMTGTLVVQ